MAFIKLSCDLASSEVPTLAIAATSSSFALQLQLSDTPRGPAARQVTNGSRRPAPAVAQAAAEPARRGRGESRARAARARGRALDPRPQVRHLRVHVPAVAGDGRRRAPRARSRQGDAPPLRREPRVRGALQVGRLRRAAAHPPQEPARAAARARARLGRARHPVAAGLRARGPADAVAAAGPRRAVRRAVRGGALRGALRLRRARLLRVPRLAPRRLGLPAVARPPPRVRRDRGRVGHVAPALRERRLPRELLARVPRAGLVRPLQPGPDPALLRVVRTPRGKPTSGAPRRRRDVAAAEGHEGYPRSPADFRAGSTS